MPVQVRCCVCSAVVCLSWMLRPWEGRPAQHQEGVSSTSVPDGASLPA